MLRRLRRGDVTFDCNLFYPMTILRRIFFTTIFTALASAISARPIAVTLETSAGLIELEVLVDEAPISGGSFLAHVDAGLLNDGGFYRTVYPENDNGSPKISVIQGGMRCRCLRFL